MIVFTVIVKHVVSIVFCTVFIYLIIIQTSPSQTQSYTIET